MITIKKISEYFLDAYNGEWGDYIEVFCNPTSKEFLQSLKNSKYKNEVRFLANNYNKNVYIFPVEMLHSKFCKKLNIDLHACLSGNAKCINNKWIFTHSSTFMDYYYAKDFFVLKQIIWQDWDWVNEFICIDDTLKNFRNKFSKFLE